MPRLHPRRWLATLLLLLAPLTATLAQPPPAGAIEPQADEVMRAWCNLLQRAQRLQLRMTITSRHETAWMRQETTTVLQLARETPNRLAVVGLNPRPGRIDLLVDGTDLAGFVPQLNKFTRRPAPATLDEIIQAPLFAKLFTDPLAHAVCLELFERDPYTSAMEGVTAGRYVGREEIAGVPCHRLHYTQEEFDWDVWIQADGAPLQRRVAFDLAKGLRAKLAAADEATRNLMTPKELSLTFDASDWRLDAPLAPELFRFTPPANAQRDDPLFDRLLKPGAETPAAEPTPEAADQALLGKPAPTFKLEQLAGGSFNLADQRGKILILDFWATWCGPCKRSLPMLTELAATFRDQGVLFRAVNQEEPAETVRGFLDTLKLDCPVLLDPDGAVGERYRVTAIPKTVLIGPDGTVQAIHVGFAPDIKQTLTGQIQALLAGKKLAGE
ncbi:MAG: DUF2092 domain-containing protein [Lentisphaeria bacterium]|jgi:peroxiredoxin